MPKRQRIHNASEQKTIPDAEALTRIRGEVNIDRFWRELHRLRMTRRSLIRVGGQLGAISRPSHGRKVLGFKYGPEVF
jgi:hypothetical protein